jgi:uncharacterized repeat protein (TIGR01451 family)
VFKSTDSGGTWAAANTGLTDSAYALAIDPTAPATVYAGTFVGVFKTTNSGATWAAAKTGFGNDPYPIVNALAIDPATPSRLYAGTETGGVFRSLDSAGTWNAANSSLRATEIEGLALHPAAPSTLYAACYGVVKSTDSGSTWAAAGTGLTGRHVYAVAVDPNTPATLYAGASGGVFKSTNSGATWAAAGTGLTESVHAVVIDPLTPATIYAVATFGSGVFKSTDSGATWAVASTGLTDNVYALAIDPATPATLYAGTWGSGVFKSTDSSATWAAADTGLTGRYVAALAVDPTTPSNLYAGTSSGVFRSVDAGGHWTLASTGLPDDDVNALAISPANPANVFAGTHNSGIFQSSDSGGTWSAANKGLKPLRMNALAVDASTPLTVYAGADGSVWQATPPAGGVLASDLRLTLSDSPDPVTGGTTLTYTLAVANDGPDAATVVSVNQMLPAGVAFVGAAGSGWTCGESGGVVTCARPGLGVGAGPGIVVQVTPGPAAATLDSSATVSAAEHDPDPANNSDGETTTVAEPAVWIGTRTKTVTADAGEFVVNGAVTYTLTIANAGASTWANNPGDELVDVLPTSLVLVSADATSGTAASDPPSSTVTWNGSLPSGGSVTVTVRATIGPTVALGAAIANQGTIHYDADGNGTNESATPTDDPGAPGATDPTSFVVVSPTMDFYTLEPCRLVDTRNETGPLGGPALVAGGDRAFPLFGQCGIPPTARALSVNLTVAQATAQGNLRLYPAGTPLPLVSTINYVAGQTRANNAIAPLNGLGELAVRCSQASGTAHFILDVNGYFE